jgi:hypothetical protein
VAVFAFPVKAVVYVAKPRAPRVRTTKVHRKFMVECLAASLRTDCVPSMAVDGLAQRETISTLTAIKGSILVADDQLTGQIGPVRCDEWV